MSGFWTNKKVLLTGHTGFKGSWMSLWLQKNGAQLLGFAQPPPTTPNLFELANVGNGMHSVISDIGRPESILEVMQSFEPEIVFHMAAQPLVGISYLDPINTYQTNVMGTVHLLDAVRQTPSVRALVVVTSDKCYENQAWHWSYRENDPMGGHDPYSSSKGCAELVTAAYRQSFFGKDSHGKHQAGVATVRAGNVIGGGDWTNGRLVPDIMRALLRGEKLALRMVNAVRPWQHVLEPLYGYQVVAEKLFSNPTAYSEAWNFGPRESGNLSVSELAEQLLTIWGGDHSWQPDTKQHPREDKFLKLDSSKALDLINWAPRLTVKETLTWIVSWYQAFAEGQDIRDICRQQIQQYEALTANA